MALPTSSCPPSCSGSGGSAAPCPLMHPAFPRKLECETSAGCSRGKGKRIGDDSNDVPPLVNNKRSHRRPMPLLKQPSVNTDTVRTQVARCSRGARGAPCCRLRKPKPGVLIGSSLKLARGEGRGAHAYLSIEQLICSTDMANLLRIAEMVLYAGNTNAFLDEDPALLEIQCSGFCRVSPELVRDHQGMLPL